MDRYLYKFIVKIRKFIILVLFFYILFKKNNLNAFKYELDKRILNVYLKILIIYKIIQYY
jgi:hypothetical protein